MPITFTPRSKYDFEVYPSSLLGTDFKNVTIEGTITPELAQREIDIFAQHRQFYPMLPNTTPDDATAYDYVVIRTQGGIRRILGLAWIDENTITLVESRTMVITIPNTKTGDVSAVRNALAANGFQNATITFSS